MGIFGKDHRWAQNGCACHAVCLDCSKVTETPRKNKIGYCEPKDRPPVSPSCGGQRS